MTPTSQKEVGDLTRRSGDTMVGVMVRKKPPMGSIYEPGEIVRFRVKYGAISKSTACRVVDCGSYEATVIPIAGSHAGEEIEVGVEMLTY